MLLTPASTIIWPDQTPSVNPPETTGVMGTAFEPFQPSNVTGPAKSVTVPLVKFRAVMVTEKGS